MGRKRILVALVAAAALFGAVISGCNRDRGADMASAGGRRRQRTQQQQPQAQAIIAEGLAVRPAEVLSASARRMTPQRSARRRGQQYVPPPEPQQYAQAPLPRQPRQPSAYQMQSGPGYSAQGVPPVYNRTAVPLQAYPQEQREYRAAAYAPQYSQPRPSAYISEPYILVPSQTRPGFYDKVYEGRDGRALPPVPVVHPSPELTVARAQLQGSAPLTDRVVLPEMVIDVPLPTPESFPVPIPELEPMRYSGSAARPRRAAPVAVAPAPAVPVSVSQVPGITPLRGWVASPTTAMRTM